MKKRHLVVWAMAFMAVAIWSFNLGSINYTIVSAQPVCAEQEN